jgi:hypothetical protein
MKYLIRTITVWVFIVSFGVFVAPNALVSAQEITPDPGAYDFSSTSEFSESQLLTEGADVPVTPAPTDENSAAAGDAAADLADTGQPVIHMVAGAVVLITGSVIVYQKRLRA